MIGVARDLLQADVQRRRHAQPASEGAGRAEAVHELILDVVREVRRRDALRRGQVHLVGLGHRVDERVLVLALRQVALRVEQADHEVAALLRVLRVGDRVVRARVLGDRRQQRGLGRAHLRGAVVEVDARRLLDAVGAVPEVDRVQVRGEDPVLRPALLELPGERGLAELAADRLLVRQVGVLDELLGDRRAALDRAVARHVRPEGARHAAHVDAAVLVEALVLGRDDRVLHPRVDPGRGDDDPRLLAAQDRRAPCGRSMRRRRCSPAVFCCAGSSCGIFAATAVRRPTVKDAVPRSPRMTRRARSLSLRIRRRRGRRAFLRKSARTGVV